VIGGPPLIKDAYGGDDDVVEIYALHVLPAYAHFAELYTVLWRAFALWAQRVSCTPNDEDAQPEIKRYKRGAFFAYEQHPAVRRLFSKHPIMSGYSDHPEADAMESNCIPHRCYMWSTFFSRLVLSS
jgi:hypothetical protein